MLCSRLKEAVQYIVAENQAAFVQGRSMVHNILVCHDLLRHYNRKTTPRCLMKIDLRKAYDMVSWEFLEEALVGFGFPIKFIRLIIACVTTPKFTIKLNGEGFGYFEGKRGLRQGDPVSPLLFVLVMEYLSRVLKTMSMLLDFKFHPMCKSLKLNHLIFADDLMIFYKGEVKSVSRVKEALAHFSATTGLVANMDKSCLFLAGMDDAEKNQLLNLTGFAKGEFPIRYLGLPLSAKKWIHSFWGSVFILPQSIVKEVDRLCRDYLWGSKSEKRKIPLVSWETVCFPKKLGGLNVKGCGTWNVASVGKLLWQLALNKESLWMKWVHGIYIKTDTIWRHKAPLDSSWYWRKINALKDRMQHWYRQGQYLLAGNGKYSISRSYLDLIGTRTKWETAELIWNSVSPPKHRFIMWLAVQQRLLTKARLLHLHIPIEDASCCLCQEQVVETSQHLFVDCMFATAVRKEVMQWSNICMPAGDLKIILRLIKHKHWKRFKKDVVAALWGAMIYHIWKARNWRQFKGRNVQYSDICGTKIITKNVCQHTRLLYITGAEICLLLNLLLIESGGIRDLVDQISKLCKTSLSYLKDIVGINTHLEGVKFLLQMEIKDVRIVGIWGMGGVSKTTIARAIFNTHSYKFEAASFLADIKENENKKNQLHSLQNTLLSELCRRKDDNANNKYDGKDKIHSRLHSMKVIIVLDDIDERDHFEYLAGDAGWFANGSIVVVTTRNRDLIKNVDAIYEVKLLPGHEATQLFY
ncbi:uncharacterized protein LOC132608097 [Lycium barbarum]|uniref:uncharacterized protein LOC132608097 n=1 Tax=Lycium barbarum TaxID=112863 RepID=UPI00293EC849|nr:uncharacterized protein LOC132608097 [Lycium barbarum]